MRTTIELPNELLKRAKIAAVERGVTLRGLVEHALGRELGPPAETPSRPRAKFPIFASKSPGALRLTAAGLAAVEAEEDARRHGRPA
jgi:hypothetical protein